MLHTVLTWLRSSRLIASLTGLAACSAALLLAVRLMRQIVQIVTDNGAAQLAPVWPQLAMLGALAGFAAMAGFAVLVYGTGGLTPWHESAGNEADSLRRNGSANPFPDAMVPGMRAAAGSSQPAMSSGTIGTPDRILTVVAGTADAVGHTSAYVEDTPSGASESAESDLTPAGEPVTVDEVPEGHVRCAACGAVNSEMIPFCAICGEDIELS